MLNEFGHLVNGIGTVLYLDDNDINTCLLVLPFSPPGVGNGFLGFDLVDGAGRDVVDIKESDAFDSGLAYYLVLQSLQMVYKHCLGNVVLHGFIGADSELSNIRIIVDDGFLLQVHGGEVVLLYLSAKTYRSHSSFTYGEYQGETDNAIRQHGNAGDFSKSTARGRRPGPLRSPEVVSRRGTIAVPGRGVYSNRSNVHKYDEEHSCFEAVEEER